MNRRLSFAVACLLLFAGGLAPQLRGEDPKSDEKEEKKVVKRAKGYAAAAAKKAATDEQDEQMQAALLEQYRPLLTHELELLRNVCVLTPEQRPKIKAAAEASLKQAVATKRGNNRQMLIQTGAFDSDEAFKTFHEKFLASLAELLTPEQVATFKLSLERRLARQKQATILLCVSRLDALLYLSSEQRDKMIERLGAAPEASWEQWSGIIHYQGNYLPNMPDDLVAPILNEQQINVWRGIQKISGNRITLRQEEPVEIDDWWGANPTKAAEAPVGGSAF